MNYAYITCIVHVQIARKREIPLEFEGRQIRILRGFCVQKENKRRQHVLTKIVSKK